jgi:hypothetical protein
LDENQKKDIEGNIDRAMTIVTQQGGGCADADQESEHRQPQRGESLRLDEGAPGQQQTSFGAFRGATFAQPSSQAPTPVQGRMGQYGGDGRGNPVQIECAVAFRQCAAGRGAFVQQLLVGAQVIFQVDKVSDRPAIGLP